MSGSSPLKEIMEEQKREALAQALERAKEIVRGKRLYCADVKSMIPVKTQEDLQTFVEKHKFLYRIFDASDINGVVNSLHVPENRTKTQRYIHPDYTNLGEETKEENKQRFMKLLGYTRLPFVYFEACYTYAYHYLIIWKEDALWKAFHFYFCRCPSGGCDSEHIDLLVGVSPQDLIQLWFFTPLYDDDKQKLFEMMKICE